MLGEYKGWDDTVIADGAITDRAVVVLSTGEASGKIAPATNSANIVGVAQAAADDGKTCNVRRAGMAEVVVADAVSIGDLVITSGALGRVESLGTLSPGTASIKYVVGEAKTAGALAGDIIVVRLPDSRHYAA